MTITNRKWGHHNNANQVRVVRIMAARPTLEPVLPASIMMLYTGTSTEADHDDPPAIRQKGKNVSVFAMPCEDVLLRAPRVDTSALQMDGIELVENKMRALACFKMGASA